LCFRSSISGDRLAYVCFQFINVCFCKRIANGCSEPLYWVCVDWKERNVAWEFDNSVLVTKSVTDIFWEVDPSPFICRLRHSVYILYTGKYMNIPVSVVDRSSDPFA